MFVFGQALRPGRSRFQIIQIFDNRVVVHQDLGELIVCRSIAGDSKVGPGNNERCEHKSQDLCSVYICCVN